MGKPKVGIVGTGATAVQAIPHLGAHAGHLYVFQRTPSTIDVRNNHHTTPEFQQEFMKPGWQKKWMENFRDHLEGVIGPGKEDLVSDGWTYSVKRMLSVATRRDLVDNPSKLKDEMDLATYEHEEQIRMRAEAVVKDPATAQKLKPWYRLFCKRPCFHDDYLTCFNRPNVTLVDTNGRGIDALTTKGVRANGTEYELDCIVLATGFETMFAIPQHFDPDILRRMTEAQGFQIYGSDGLHLLEHWTAGPRTYLSIMTRGFPNIFWLNGPQGLISSSATFTLDLFATHIAHIIAKMRREKKVLIEPSETAQEEYCQLIFDGSTNKELSAFDAPFSANYLQQCTPGYYSNEGNVVMGRKTLSATFPGYPGEGPTPRLGFLARRAKEQAEDNVFVGFDVA